MKSWYLQWGDRRWQEALAYGKLRHVIGEAARNVHEEIRYSSAVARFKVKHGLTVV